MAMAQGAGAGAAVPAAGSAAAGTQGKDAAAGVKAEGAAEKGVQGAGAGGVGPGEAKAGPSVMRNEAPVEGLVRRDAGTVALALQKGAGAGAMGELLLHEFSFNGDPVSTTKLHLRQVAPGVVEVTSLAYSVGEWRFGAVDKGGSYYGTGERFDTLNRAHTVVRNAAEDAPGAKGTAAYKPMPFFMSTSGYGMWVDTTAEATFDFNVSRPGEVRVTVPSERLRVVLFTQPEFPKMLEAFTRLTQRAVVPPAWAFAPWVGRDVHHNEAEVLEDVRQTRALGLPAGVLLIDSPWATAYNSYRLNLEQFADVPGMVKAIHGAGLKLVLWHTPWINSASDAGAGEPRMPAKSPNYDEAAEKGYFVKRADGTPYVGRWWKGQGSLIDFTNPAAKLWWQDQLRGVMAEGADGFKDDDGEGVYQGADVVWADKTPASAMRNRYAVLYNNAVEEIFKKDRKGDGVVLARSVTQGANGTGFLWGGDNEASFSPENGLPTAVTAGLNAGMSGMPLWTADLGGYLKGTGPVDGTLLARWTEFSAFSPVMELLSQWNLQPWMWDGVVKGGGTGVSTTPMLDLYRRYAVGHMQLLPYRMAAAQESARDGMPVMRALPLVFQGDRAAREARAEYMLGPELLVAPVVDAGTQRVVYLPAGQWVNWWTGKTETGGRTVVVDAPVEVIPVWARAGAVLGELPEDVMTVTPADGGATVQAMDDRRVWEVVGDAGETVQATDFEGRTVVRAGRSLVIEPAKDGDGAKPVRATVRWRFGGVASATVNGSAMGTSAKGMATEVTFPMKGRVEVKW